MLIFGSQPGSQWVSGSCRPGLRGLRALGLENPVHGRRALGERGPDLVTVDRLGDRRAAVPNQVADVLQPDIVRAEDGYERVPQFAGRPCPAEPGGRGDLLELLPYLPAVQPCPVLAAEHQTVFLPQLPRREPFGGLAGVVDAECLGRLGGQLEDAAALAGLGVALDPHGPEDGHRAGLEVNLVPRDRPRFLGADTGEQGQDHVGREPVRAGLDGLQEHDGLAERHRLGRPAFLPFGHIDQAGDVAADLVACLRLADRALDDLVDQPEQPRRQFLGALVQPVVKLVRGQFLDLDAADLRDHVVIGERAVVVDGSFGPCPSVLSPGNRSRRLRRCTSRPS